MLSTCESFGKEFDVKFNPKRSEYILFKRKGVSQKLVQYLIYLDGVKVTWKKSVKTLGELHFGWSRGGS
jgi:hypothetical protein